MGNEKFSEVKVCNQNKEECIWIGRNDSSSVVLLFGFHVLCPQKENALASVLSVEGSLTEFSLYTNTSAFCKCMCLHVHTPTHAHM